MFSFNGLIYHTLHRPGKHRQFSSESLIPGESWSIESKSNIKIVTSQESTGENVVVISLAVRLKQWKWKRKKIHNMNCNQTRGWSNEVLRFMGFVCLLLLVFFGGGGAKNTSLSFKWLLTVENKEADSCWLHIFPLLWFDSQGFIQVETMSEEVNMARKAKHSSPSGSVSSWTTNLQYTLSFQQCVYILNRAMKIYFEVCVRSVSGALLYVCSCSVPWK